MATVGSPKVDRARPPALHDRLATDFIARPESGIHRFTAHPPSDHEREAVLMLWTHLEAGTAFSHETSLRHFGLADPQERNLKAQLASRIYDEIETRGWTQTQAASRLGLSQPDVSRLTHGNLKGFSVERLMGFLAALDYRVSIHIEGENRPTEDIQVASPS